MQTYARNAGLYALAAASLVSACTDRALNNEFVGADWQVASEPVFSVGSVGDSPETALDVVAGAARLSSGSIVVAEGRLGSSRLSAFSSEGRRLGLIGTTGDGPGEFRWITHLLLGPADSIYVFDQGLQRLTVFRSDGRRVRTANFTPGTGGTGSDGLRFVARLSDGVWVGRGTESPIWGEPSLLLRDTISLGVMDGSLESFDRIGRLPGVMSTTFERDGRSVLTIPTFSAHAMVATWGRCMFAASGEDASVSVYSSEGALVTTLTGPGEPRPVLQEHVDSLLAFRLRDAPAEAEPQIRSGLRQVARTPYLPYYDSMVIDEWGHIWLEEYVPPLGMGTHWYVVSQTGQHLGEVTLPRPMRVFTITEHGILGAASGEFDEDIVELLPLVERPESPAPLEACRAG